MEKTKELGKGFMWGSAQGVWSWKTWADTHAEWWSLGGRRLGCQSRLSYLLCCQGLPLS